MIDAGVGAATGALDIIIDTDDADFVVACSCVGAIDGSNPP